MSEVKLMQEMLDSVINKIAEIEESISECKNDPSAKMKYMELKKSLATQERVKITLVQSIQELSPSSNTLTTFRKHTSFLGKIRQFLWGK